MAAMGYILIFGVLTAFAVSTIWALWWAIGARQFEEFSRGAASIFDADETVGRRTDGFPDEERHG